jgi:hypothetical protein
MAYFISEHRIERRKNKTRSRTNATENDQKQNSGSFRFAIVMMKILCYEVTVLFPCTLLVLRGTGYDFHTELLNLLNSFK